MATEGARSGLLGEAASSRAVVSALGGADGERRATSLAAGVIMTSVTAVSSDVRLAIPSRWRLVAPSSSRTASGGGLGAVWGAVSSTLSTLGPSLVSGADGRGGGGSSRAAAAGRGGTSVSVGAPVMGPSVRRGGGRLPSGGSASGADAEGRGASWVEGAAGTG